MLHSKRLFVYKRATIIALSAASICSLFIMPSANLVQAGLWDIIAGCALLGPLGCLAIAYPPAVGSDYGNVPAFPTYVQDNTFDVWIFADARTPGTIPLYEYVKYERPDVPTSSRVGFYYTVKLDQSLYGKGYRIVGIAGYVYPTDSAAPGTVPLNKYLYTFPSDNYLYTTKTPDQLFGTVWRFQGTEGRVYDKFIGNTPSPLTRLYHYEVYAAGGYPRQFGEFYTIHPTEVDQFADKNPTRVYGGP